MEKRERNCGKRETNPENKEDVPLTSLGKGENVNENEQMDLNSEGYDICGIYDEETRKKIEAKKKRDYIINEIKNIFKIIWIIILSFLTVVLIIQWIYLMIETDNDSQSLRNQTAAIISLITQVGRGMQIRHADYKK